MFMQRRCFFKLSCHEEGGAVLLGCILVWLFCRSVVLFCRLVWLFCGFIRHFYVSTKLFCIFVGFICGLFCRFVGLFCVRVGRLCTRLCGGGVSSSLSRSEKGGAVLLVCRLLQGGEDAPCHVFTLYFPQKSRIISGSFAKNDLHLKASYGPCSRSLLQIHKILFRLAGHFCGSIRRTPFR